MKNRWLVLGILASLGSQAAAPVSGPLEEGFVSPLTAARPRVWWHWMNGNVTKEGIRLDFEWMKRVGIGGVQNFDANLGTPQMVEKRLVFMTPEWRDAFRYAAGLANDLGLEMAIAGSPGWSETGGPWVKPEQAMKKVVWSETVVEGGTRSPRLAPPPTVGGPYQNVPARDAEGAKQILYRDTRVLAYRVPRDAEEQGTAGRLSASSQIELAALQDGDVAKSIALPYGADNRAWIRIDYPAARTVQSVAIAMPGGYYFGAPPAPRMWLEASEDGTVFRRIVELLPGAGQFRTATFAPASAASFRVVFEAVPGRRVGQEEGTPGAIGVPFPPIASNFDVAEITLYRQARVHRFDEKAGFAAALDYNAIPTPAVGPGSIVPRSGVVDLTSKLRPDGTLDWTAPRGRWIVQRFGYSLTGHRNGPASPEATGLEADKLNAAHMRAYLEHYLDLYKETTGPELMGSKGVTALLTDSIESGPQNWTDNMLEEFARRRGYDAVPWMPTLTGVVVESAAATDRFLWDFRQTISELVTDVHYRIVAEMARERGLTLYGEALEDRRPQLGDDIAMRRFTTIPMAAMWVNPPGVTRGRSNYWADITGAASVAHVYGQNLAAAESLTSSTMPWAHTPRDLKETADLEMAYGINRFVIHTSIHQPLIDKVPGLALSVQLGQYFNRNETWADMADAWITYLARSSHLLQQGRFAADVAYFHGEEAPLTAQFVGGPPTDLPRHHGVDFVNADILREELSVREGALVTRSGMRYRVLYLGGSSRRMTMKTLVRIGELARAGAVVVGEKPVESPTLSDDPAAFQSLAEQLWQGADHFAGAPAGSGRIMAGVTAEDALQRLGVARDFDYGAATDILTQHRTLADGEIYFVNSRSSVARQVDAVFRVSGRVPEIWRAETGEKVPVSYRREGALTRVRLEMAPADAFFVVFRGTTDRSEAEYSAPRVQSVVNLTGPWSLSFQTNRGAPEQPVTLASLGMWNESADPRIRYFSGVGSYRRACQKFCV